LTSKAWFVFRREEGKVSLYKDVAERHGEAARGAFELWVVRRGVLSLSHVDWEIVEIFASVEINLLSGFIRELDPISAVDLTHNDRDFVFFVAGTNNRLAKTLCPNADLYSVIANDSFIGA